LVTADLAVVAMAAIALVNAGLDHRFRMKVADRLRVVNPPKQQSKPASEASSETGTAEKLPSILDLPRAGKEGAA
jgi:hypothetical protein